MSDGALARVRVDRWTPALSYAALGFFAGSLVFDDFGFPARVVEGLLSWC